MDTATQLAIQKILAVVDTYRATDIHFSVGNPPMMRVNGKLSPIPEQPLITPDFMTAIGNEWLDEVDRERLQEQKDLTIGKTFENKRRFRIALYYQQGFLSATLTAVPHQIPSLAEAGLPPDAQALADIESGIVLVIGPYGAHQTLTVASIIEHLNQTAQKHVVTFERPVEVLFADQRCVIDQREIGKDVIDVHSGLTTMLEEDVDVVVLTDLSDPRSLPAMLQVPNAGKAVFAVMNASTIVSALSYIVHQFSAADQPSARAELARSLLGVVNQRVVETVSGDRTVVAEVMIPNPAIRAIIQQGDLFQINNVMATSRGQQGLRTMDTALAEAVQQGIISGTEAARHATDPGLFFDR